MNLSIIAAIGKKLEIGFQNDLPWRISKDLQNFKNLTMGHFLLMGRKTYHSIGKALPGRKLIILTSDPYYEAGEHFVAHSLDEAICIAERKKETELMVCGGAKVYKDCLPLANKLYLSKIDYTGDADVYFPEFDESEWKLLKEESHEKCKEDPAWVFQVFEKSRP